MSIPGMYIVGLTANIIFLVLSIVGYIYLAGKTGNKYLFLIFFALAWLISALSYVLLISGVSADALSITLSRIVTYIFFLATIVSIIVELAKSKKTN